MASWLLSFAHPQSLSIEICERLMATFVGAPVQLTIGELSGNPRDFYSRSITITGRRGDLEVTLSTSQAMRGDDDPEAIITHAYVTLQSDTYATKLAAWRELQDAFAAIGCCEQTLQMGAAPILDDAKAAGDETTANLLRDNIAGALVAQARLTRSVGITSPRVDIEPILLAYEEPEHIVSFTLSDCGLRSLPVAFARFPNMKSLSLEEDAFDGSILRGVSLPKLESLRLAGKSLRRVTKDDLAGFPALEILSCINSPLEELDPNVIDVCPKLVRVYVQNTPLARNERAMADLRMRWPGMKWSYWDLSTRASPFARVPPVAKLAAPPPQPVAPPPAPPVVAAPRPSFVNGVLDLDSAKLRNVERLRELIATGDYRSAIEVRLHYVHLGDAVAELLAPARAFPKLVVLDLGGSGIGDAGARALATQAVELDALEILHLGDAVGSHDASVGGVSDAAVDMLARSPRLPALRQITRCFTHHVYAAGARDDQETTTIERDDGRVVQSTLSHFLWP